MLIAKDIINKLKDHDIDFFAWVPDSSLKDLIAYITDNIDNRKHIITANEWNAIWLASWYYLSTWKIPCVYMQNSWLWNAVNPITSLADEKVYNIPMLLFVWRRWEPWKKDEPQHIKQWEITIPLLNVLWVRNEILSDNINIANNQIEEAIKYIEKTKKLFAFVVKKWTFEKYELQNKLKNDFKLSREEALKILIDNIEDNSVIISTTWKLSRELFEYREEKKQWHEKDFLTVWSMGHTSQIALWVALNTTKRTYCLDGDGSVIMHMWWLFTIWDLKPKNFVHIMFNNWAHQSVWWQPTVAYKLNFKKIVEWLWYNYYFQAKTENEIKKVLWNIKELNWPIFIELFVNQNDRKDLWRPTTTPIENKTNFMNYLKKYE